MKFLKLQFRGLSFNFYLLLFLTSFLITTISIHYNGGLLSIIVALLGIAYVFFAGQGKWICFVFGILYSCLYLYIAYQNRLYGDVMLNILYLPINLAGIILWKKHQNQERTKIMVTSLDFKGWILYSGIVLIATYVYGIYLQSLEASFAYLNAFSTIAQIVAFYLQVKRYVQNYLLVTLANLTSLLVWWLIYSSDQEQIAQLLNMIIFFIAGIYYYFAWKKDLK